MRLCVVALLRAHTGGVGRRGRVAMSRTIVAIDGPAGSGKSSVARIAASKLGLTYVDTGATYRLVALQALRSGVALDDAQALARLSEETMARCRIVDGCV